MAGASLRFFCMALVLALTASVVRAEPVTLRLAFISSDRSTLYRSMVQPFVEAVNADPAGAVKIAVRPSGALGKDPTQQLRLVVDGTADIAWIVPGDTPGRFRDDAVVHLPLFRNMREATLVYHRLVAANALDGYDDLFVIAAFATEPGSIHTRRPVGSLDHLKGKRIRANNPIEAVALRSLGMTPVLMPINQAATAISGEEIDGAVVPPMAAVEFGIARVAANHYLLGVGSVPLLLVMNRRRFDGLPEQAQDIIRKYSGDWMIAKGLPMLEAADVKSSVQLRIDPSRIVVVPSQSDNDRAERAFSGVVLAWLAANPRRAALLAMARAELATIRAGQ